MTACCYRLITSCVRTADPFSVYVVTSDSECEGFVDILLGIWTPLTVRHDGNIVEIQTKPLQQSYHPKQNKSLYEHQFPQTSIHQIVFCNRSVHELE